MTPTEDIQLQPARDGVIRCTALLADAPRLPDGTTQKGRRGNDPKWRHITPNRDRFRVRITYAKKVHDRPAETFEDAQQIRDELKRELGCAKIEQTGIIATVRSNTGHKLISRSWSKNPVGTLYPRFEAVVYGLGGQVKRKAFYATIKRGGEDAALLAAIQWRKNEIASEIQTIFNLPAKPLALVLVNSGGFAMVDASDLPVVEKFRWTWMIGRGVAAFETDQTILLHNLIAPYARVSFKNRDKRDCRRENLMAFDNGNHAGRGRGNNLYLDKRNSKWAAHRKVIEGGDKFVWGTSIAFGRDRDKDEARQMAQAIVDRLFEMSREQFIEFVKFARSKKTTNQIISELDVFGGAEMNMGAVSQIGMFNNRDE